ASFPHPVASGAARPNINPTMNRDRERKSSLLQVVDKPGRASFSRTTRCLKDEATAESTPEISGAIALDRSPTSAHALREPSARYDTKRDSFPYKNALGSRPWPMDVHARESGSPMRSFSVAPPLRKSGP